MPRCLAERLGVGCGDPWCRRCRQVASGGGVGERAEQTVASLSGRVRPVSATMPFGAFAHLLPTGVLTRDDPVDRYREIVDGLPHRQGRLVVYVDDLQHLDAATVGLLAQLLDGGEVFLVATVRTTTIANPVVASLWRRDDVVRIDLKRSVETTSTRCSTSCSAGRSIPMRSRRSGRRARGMRCSCASSCSAHATAATSCSGGGSGGCGDRSRARRG